jgi:hypothetical protein
MPISLHISNISFECTYSAIVFMPRSFANATIALAIEYESLLISISLIIEPSIFT